MRWLPLLGVLFLAATSLASAQVQVSAQTERSHFLLYERVDLLVTVENVSGSDIVLNNEEGSPWLSFLVSRDSRGNYLPVKPERGAEFQPLSLKAGESKTLRVNLTPLFSFREEGEYRASVVVDLPGAAQMISEPVPFSVMNGLTLWTQSRPVDGIKRIYSLIAFSPTSSTTNLYLRVESPTENLVYANLALGEISATNEPEVFFDPQGNIHVLQPVAMATYLYSRADQDGKVEHQGIFKSTPVPGDPSGGLIPPRLAKLDDGSVFVSGGTEGDPNERRERLSDPHGESKAASQTMPLSAPDAAPAADASPLPNPAQ